jgi:hypothetical protein
VIAMRAPQTATIRPALAADLDAVTEYLARTLGAADGRAPAHYRRVLDYRWLASKPDLGVVIEDAGRVRGFLGAIYAERVVDGAARRFCNLTSIAVDESHRSHTLRAFAALLSDKDRTYTCFSANEQVAKILEFYKFHRTPPAKVLVGPGSGLGGLARRVRVISDPARLAGELDPAQQAIARDHAPYRCAQLVLAAGARRCFMVAVRRGRGVRAFADVLHASDPDLLVTALPWIQLPLWRALGTVLTGIDERWVRVRPRLAAVYTKLRPMHVRSSTLVPDQIDALYSELVPLYGARP